jgi:hypothetical protein
MKTSEIEKKLDSIESEVKKLRNSLKTSTADKNKEMSDFLFGMLNKTIREMTEDRKVTHIRASDNEWLFQQDYENGILWVRYLFIWSVFKSKYGLNDEQIKSFIAAWVEKNTEWKGLTPVPEGF